jgi:methylmalonyl-CoA/ethylmalonyl-CoA epimerase
MYAMLTFRVTRNEEVVMKINKIDHICIAVKNLAEARKAWEPLLGSDKPDDEYVDEREKIRVVRYMVGEVGFELMESTSPDGDVAEVAQELQGKGYSLISDARGEIARPFRDCEFAFVHPKKLNGVLTEIIDYKWEEVE